MGRQKARRYEVSADCYHHSVGKLFFQGGFVVYHRDYIQTIQFIKRADKDHSVVYRVVFLNCNGK